MSDLFNSASFDTDEILIEEDGTVVDTTELEGIQENTGGPPADVVEELQEDLIEVELKSAEDVNEEEEEIKNDLDKPPSNVKSGSSSVIVPFASALQEKGILSQENIKTIEESEDPSVALFEIMEENDDAKVNTWIESLPENLKFVLSNYKEGVPLNDLINAQSEETSVASLTEADIVDNEAKQEAVYKEYYKEKGLSDAKRDKDMSRAKELGLLSDDSIELHKELLAIKSSKKLEVAAAAKEQLKLNEAANQQTLENIKETIKDIDAIIPGVKVNKKGRENLLRNMTMPYKDNKSYAQVKREEDPIAFEMRLNYFIEQGFFNKDADFKTLKGAVKTTAAKEFENKLKREGASLNTGTMSAKGMHSVHDDNEEKVDWKAGLSNF